MKFADIKEMTNEKLLAAFYWATVRATNETNSKRGLSQKTLKEEKWITEELVKRFNLDASELDRNLNPENY